jgi:hypothetical protein
VVKQYNSKARKDEDKFDYNKDADRFICPLVTWLYERLPRQKNVGTKTTNPILF